MLPTSFSKNREFDCAVFAIMDNMLIALPMTQSTYPNKRLRVKT